MPSMRRLALLLLVACSHQAPSHPPAELPDASVLPPDVDATVAVDGPAAVDPTACVDWYTWPVQQPNLGQAAWGTQLTDIAQHLPSQYGDQYWSDDAITAGHETSHGISAHLRNYEAPPGHVNAFYVLGDHAAFVDEPNMRKSDIAAAIPDVLHGPRYDLYLTGQTEWDDTPLYVFDEWNAYVNGAEVGVGQVQAGLYTGQWTDGVMGPLEFTAYALATAKAIQDKDPTYFASNTQFRCFTAWQIARSMRLYEAGRVMTQFSYDVQEQFATTLRTDPAAQPLRDIARSLWGASWTQSTLGF
jgi:hypothetical protein